ncbi:MAG: hypothetical protein AABZ02_09435, partial [Bacteroidota bacterium]
MSPVSSGELLRTVEQVFDVPVTRVKSARFFVDRTQGIAAVWGVTPAPLYLSEGAQLTIEGVVYTLRVQNGVAVLTNPLWGDVILADVAGENVLRRGQVLPNTPPQEPREFQEVTASIVPRTSLLDQYRRAPSVLKEYQDDPAFTRARGIVLRFIGSVGERASRVLYHGIPHWNELFDFHDVLTESARNIFRNPSQAIHLNRLAILTHDVGYYQETFARDHEEKSKRFVLDHQQAFGLTHLEAEAVLYRIDHTKLEMGPSWQAKVALEDRVYAALDVLNRGEVLASEDSRVLDEFVLDQFPAALVDNPAHRHLIMDAITGARIIALADIWGQDSTYTERVALLQQEFKEDGSTAAAPTGLEQVAASPQFTEVVMTNRFKSILESAVVPLGKYVAAARRIAGDDYPSLLEERNREMRLMGDISARLGRIKEGRGRLGDLYTITFGFINQGFQDGVYTFAQTRALWGEAGTLIRQGYVRRIQNGLQRTKAFLESANPFHRFKAPVIDGKGGGGGDDGSPQILLDTVPDIPVG